MSNPSSPPFFAKATKGIHLFRKLYYGLPFEASGTEAKNGGDGSKFAVGEVEAGAKGFLEGFSSGFEEEMEQVAALAEDAAEDFGDARGRRGW